MIAKCRTLCKNLIKTNKQSSGGLDKSPLSINENKTDIGRVNFIGGGVGERE